MNLATESMQKLTHILYNTDAKLKEWGKEPYGTRKLTAAQQRERIKNMTPQDLMALIDEHGEQEVNAWLSKYWRE